MTRDKSTSDILEPTSPDIATRIRMMMNRATKIVMNNDKRGVNLEGEFGISIYRGLRSQSMLRIMQGPHDVSAVRAPSPRSIYGRPLLVM